MQGVVRGYVLVSVSPILTLNFNVSHFPSHQVVREHEPY